MYWTVPTVNPVAVLVPPSPSPAKWMGRMAGCCSRASALASWRKRVTIPGVQAISGCSTLQASRRSRSLSHSSYTSAKPPRPTSRRTSYLSPSARARRCAVGTPASAAAGAAAAGSRTTRSFVITVGDGVPQDGQNAEPEGIAARHEGQVSWVVTAPKICVRGARCKLSSAYKSLRSEEHTSELQSRLHLVCRLLLEKKTRTGSQSAAIDLLQEAVGLDPLSRTVHRRVTPALALTRAPDGAANESARSLNELRIR